MQNRFGRFSSRITNVMKDSGLDSIGIEFIPFKKPGMYGGSTIYLSDTLDELSAFRVVLHELGHAYRDMHNGPIFNYMMCKDLSGNPIGVEDAVTKVMEEESEATKWANEQLVKMKSNLKLKDYSGDRGNDKDRQQYYDMIKEIMELGIQSEPACIEHFLEKGKI
jgi:hypothetical protein